MMSITPYPTNSKGGKGGGAIYHYNHWWNFIIKKEHPSKRGKEGTTREDQDITKWYNTQKCKHITKRCKRD